MSSTPQKGKAQASRSPKTQPKGQKGQPKVVAAPRRPPQQALIPWYFWLVLGGAVILGVVLVGTFVNPVSSPPKSSAAVQSALTPGLNLTPAANITADARDLLTNGYGEGNPNAPIKAVEYGDFQCPSCETFFQQDYARVKQVFVDSGLVYYYYKLLPLTSIHPKAMRAAELATCVGDHGTDKFWAMHDLLYANQSAWVKGDENTLWPQYVKQLGLDSASVMDCVAKNTHSAMINSDIKEAISLKIPGTPEFYVNSQVLAGANFTTFSQAVAAAQKQ